MRTADCSALSESAAGVLIRDDRRTGGSNLLVDNATRCGHAHFPHLDHRRRGSQNHVGCPASLKVVKVVRLSCVETLVGRIRQVRYPSPVKRRQQASERPGLKHLNGSLHAGMGVVEVARVHMRKESPMLLHVSGLQGLLGRLLRHLHACVPAIQSPSRRKFDSEHHCTSY